MSQKIDQLMSCYDSQAQHFHHTRAFHKRPELEHIHMYLNQVFATQHPGEQLRLLDLGCGTGRIYEWLTTTNLSDRIDYTGVDLSQGMITQCNKNYPDGNFIQENMIDFLGRQSQQSYDAILCLASFHHLTSKKDRLQFLHNAYRALKYGGKLILINRSLSDWFRNKYHTAIQAARWKYIYTLGTSHHRDILVPWIDGNTKQKFDRYYHLFTLEEICGLIHLTSYDIDHLSYIDQDGKLNSDLSSSRNSICVLAK